MRYKLLEMVLLLSVLIILGIAVILDRREKSQEQSDKLDKQAKSERDLSTPRGVETQTPENTVQTDNNVAGTEITPETPSISEPKTPYHTTRLSEPPNYPDSWEKDSRHYREQKEWQCEMCKLSLHQHKYYLHTHHIYGTRYDNLMALCIGCHSEQPGINHLLLKETPDYQGLLQDAVRKKTVHASFG